MSDRIRIFLVDDHRLFRDGLRRLLSSGEHFEVVGEAGNGREFLEIAGTLPCLPDVVFMDIDMPQFGGIEASKRALELWQKSWRCRCTANRSSVCRW